MIETNIIDRLNLFLEQFEITKSQFADNCDIPRPTASQILSGRNKKISDDIIGKIHNVYPQLSIPWLMFGEGDMILPGYEDITPKPSENSIFESVSGVDAAYGVENAPKQQSETLKRLNNKEIIKIVVFYSDNSFEEFYKNL